MDLESFEGANTLLCIDFLKLWGGQWPPWPPSSGGPELLLSLKQLLTSYYTKLSNCMPLSNGVKTISYYFSKVYLKIVINRE